MSKAQKRKNAKIRKLHSLRKILACATLFAALGFGVHAKAADVHFEPTDNITVDAPLLSDDRAVVYLEVGSDIQTGDNVTIGTAVGTTKDILLNASIDDWGDDSTSGVKIDGNFTSGSLRFGKMTIERVDADEEGALYGLNIQGNNGASITGGMIDIYTGNGNATGLFIDGNNSVYENKVDGIRVVVSSDGDGVDNSTVKGNAVGIDITGNSTGNVEYGEIVAKTYGMENGQAANGAIGLNIGGTLESHTTEGDITAYSAIGHATGISAAAFTGTNGLVIEHTITATSDIQGYGTAVKDTDGTKSSSVTITKDAVLDADGSAVSFTAASGNNVSKTLVFDIRDSGRHWNNDDIAMSTTGASDIVFKSGSNVTVNGMHLLADGTDSSGSSRDSTITIESGAKVLIDGRADADRMYGFMNSATTTVEQGASLDARGLASTGNPGRSNTVIDGKLNIAGTVTFRGNNGQNTGLFVNAGGASDAITVGQNATLNLVLTSGQSNIDFQVADGNWSNAAQASGLFGLNEFYNISAYNGNTGGRIVANARDVVYMPELYILGSQLHHYRTISDAVGHRFAQDRQVVACYVPPCEVATNPRLYQDAYGPDDCQSRRDGVWLNWVGRVNDGLRSTSMGQDMRFESDGVQVGYDMLRQNRLMLGAMVGYAKSRYYANDDYGSKMRGKDHYFGLYGQYILRSGFDLNGTIGYGRQKFNHYRNNIRGMHDGDFKSHSFEASVELGYLMNMSAHSFLRPVVGIDMYNYDTDGMTESSGLVFGGNSLTQVFLRLGAEGEWSRNRLSINGGMFYQYQMNKNAKEAWAMVTDPSQGGIAVPMAYKLGRSIITLNLGGRFLLNQRGTVALFADYAVDFYTDRINDQALHTGTLGIRWEF